MEHSDGGSLEAFFEDFAESLQLLNVRFESLNDALAGTLKRAEGVVVFGECGAEILELGDKDWVGLKELLDPGEHDEHG